MKYESYVVPKLLKGRDATADNFVWLNIAVIRRVRRGANTRIDAAGSFCLVFVYRETFFERTAVCCTFFFYSLFSYDSLPVDVRRAHTVRI